MSTAICVHCAKGKHISLGRGVKLNEMRCPCGGRLAMTRWSPRGFVPRSDGQASLIRLMMENAGHKWDGYAKEESYGDKNY